MAAPSGRLPEDTWPGSAPTTRLHSPRTSLAQAFKVRHRSRRWPRRMACLRIRSGQGTSQPWRVGRTSAHAGGCGPPRMMTRGKRGSTSRSGRATVHATGANTTLESPREPRRPGVAPPHERLRVRRPCPGRGVHRSGWYDPAVAARVETLPLRRWRDEPSTRGPVYGVRRMTAWWPHQGDAVHAQRGRRWWRQMGCRAVSPQPRLRQPGAGPQRSPSVLTGRTSDRSDHVWSTDITDVRRSQGGVDLLAMMAGSSRAGLSWEVSVPGDRHVGGSALERALIRTPPDIFHAEPGAPCTRLALTEPLGARGRLISRDGRGRVVATIVGERRWRRVPSEEVSLQEYRRVPDALQGWWRDVEGDNGAR
jgi:putative transposase